MKKVILAILLMFSLSSCYDDYVNDYDFNAVYFAKQINTRTVVVGEGQKIKIGAVLSGVMKNKTNRNVNFEIDNSLITPKVLSSMKNSDSYIRSAVAGVNQLKLLPEEYYVMSDARTIVIPKGDHLGNIDLTVTDKFISDSETLKATYVLPLRITTADADSINRDKCTTIIGLHYENTLFGNYYHGGVTEVKDANGKLIETIEYKLEIPQPDRALWKLSTVAPNALITNKVSNGSIPGKMKITLNEDGTIAIDSVEGSGVVVQPDGESTFNNAKLLQDRQLNLNYKFTDSEGNVHHAKDVLVFRNRIRDGVNEWKDENPEHYK